MNPSEIPTPASELVCDLRSSRRLTASDDPLSPNNKPIGRRPNEVERIASHQGEDLVVAGIKDGYVAGVNHLCGDDPVTVLGVDRCQRDDVVLPDIPQGPEERVAVGGNAHVARNSGHSRPGDVARGAPQGRRGGPLDYHRGKAQPTDFDAA